MHQTTGADLQAGRLERIWIKRAKRGVMDPALRATLQANRGIEGNANRGGRRQVTIIEAETWERLMKEMQSDIDPALRRANLMIRGVSLVDARGKILRVGGCRIEIMGETKPCERMDEALPGLRAAMRPAWGGGAFGVILDDGEIRVGDPVELI
jgi:MOSC domain-containing protein YiiM